MSRYVCKVQLYTLGTKTTFFLHFGEWIIGSIKQTMWIMLAVSTKSKRAIETCLAWCTSDGTAQTRYNRSSIHDLTMQWLLHSRYLSKLSKGSKYDKDLRYSTVSTTHRNSFYRNTHQVRRHTVSLNCDCSWKNRVSEYFCLTWVFR